MCCPYKAIYKGNTYLNLSVYNETPTQIYNDNTCFTICPYPLYMFCARFLSTNNLVDKLCLKLAVNLLFSH